MGWLRAEIRLGTADPSPAEDALLAAGALAIELGDGGDEPILEPAPGATPLWTRVVVAGLFPGDAEAAAIRAALHAALGADISLGFRRIDDADWVAAFRAGLEPRRFGQRLWVCPTDAAIPGAAETVLRLDPGLAFGTGSHATTALCLEWLDTHVAPGDAVLDFGCGSGILALAALALGASRAVAVDNDPQALAATRDNAALNGLAGRLALSEPAGLAPAERFDRVVANILSGTLIELAPRLAAHCRPGGTIALSGILSHQAEAVRAAFLPWIDFGPDRQREAWLLVGGRRRADG